MDGHNTEVFISMAGAQNGLFNGSQPSDQIVMAMFMNVIGPQLLPAQYLNFSQYKPAEYYGKAQRDFAELATVHHELQNVLSVFNMDQFPLFSEWVRANTFLPTYNNVNACLDSDDEQQHLFCEQEKKRRRANFLRLEVARFFASPIDDVISPWQSSILEQYSEVETLEQIESKLPSFYILPLNETREYLDDTYGLRALDERGGLFFHVVENVGHSCWLYDYARLGSSEVCEWVPLYDAHLDPMLQQPTKQQ